MDPRAFLHELETDPDTADPLVHLRTLEARDPVIEPFPDDLPELLVARLGLTGVLGLYRHQSDGLAALRSGRDVVIATGTASGKTLVYDLAFAEARDPGRRSTALYLFPTKALARDQLRQIRELKLPQVRAAVYDGDTPSAERPMIRKNANLVLTNPDMLHCRHPAGPRAVGGLLPSSLARRGRRGARVPRGVRLSRRDGAAPPPAARGALRRRSAVVPRERDRRQSGGARDEAHRARASRRSPRTRRRAARSSSPCGTRP